MLAIRQPERGAYGLSSCKEKLRDKTPIICGDRQHFFNGGHGPRRAGKMEFFPSHYALPTSPLPSGETRHEEGLEIGLVGPLKETQPRYPESIRSYVFILKKPFDDGDDLLIQFLW